MRMYRLHHIALPVRFGMFIRAVRYNLSPASAYYLDPRHTNLGDFVTRSNAGLILRLLRELSDQDQSDIIDNKRRFEQHFGEQGVSLPCPSVLCRISPPVQGQTRVIPVEPDTEMIFVKREHLFNGRGASAWTRSASGQWVSGDLELPWDQVVEHLQQGHGANQDTLVYRRLENHAQIRDLSLSALNTLRVVTIMDPQLPKDKPIVLNLCMYSMGIDDNPYDSGGIFSAVKDGKLQTAISIKRFGWFDTHPTTGAKIKGRTLPYYQDAVELAAQAHRNVPCVYAVGWDIAITDEGPVLIEGNTLWDTCGQHAHQLGLGQTEFAPLAIRLIEQRLKP
jgi:hypothetical protein